MKNNKRKVYLIVYACEPNQGGEHEVGWKIANELIDKCKLIVVTRKSNQKLIEQYNHNIDFKFIENSIFLKFKPKGKFSYLYYLFWQFSVYLYLKKKVGKEDIVHYLTFGNIHLPHFLFLLKSNLILGPMGGGSVIDTQLMRNTLIKIKVKSYIHKVINWTVKLNPIYYFLFIKSSKIMLRTEETLKIIPKKFHYKCSVCLETGINIQDISINNSKERKLKQIITTARIINSKNIDQVIKVFLELVEIQNNPLELLIVGDGPQKIELEKKYTNIQNIKFLGKVAHKKIKPLIQKADLFLFCSIKEGGSHSLFEASMNNCPIACYDISGMKEFPKSDSSIKIIPTSNIDNNIKELAQRIVEAFDNNKVDELCKNAIYDLKKNYDWQKLGKKYIKIYEEIK